MLHSLEARLEVQYRELCPWARTHTAHQVAGTLDSILYRLTVGLVSVYGLRGDPVRSVHERGWRARRSINRHGAELS